MSKPRILIVLTSHDQLGNTGKKTGFWLEELADPYYVFVDGGAEVTLASIKGGLPPVDPKSDSAGQESKSSIRFKADAEANAKLRSTLAITEVKADNYDAIFLPGGHGAMWDFPDNTTLINLIEAFGQRGKLISAVCHAPAALVNVKSAGVPLVKGRLMTAFTDDEERAVQLEHVVPFLLETRLRELGARFEGGENFQPLVHHDGNLITGQNPASSGPAAEKTLEALTK